MAVRILLQAVLLCGLYGLAEAAPFTAGDETRSAESATLKSGAGALQATLPELLARSFRPHSRRKPEWVQQPPEVQLDAELHSIGRDAWRLVLQQQRRDGAELLTLRLPLTGTAAIRTYAGAGLNQSRYYASDDYGFTRFNRRNRQRSLGAAAELGAEFAISQRVRLGADLRWMELDDRAVALQSEGRLVSADPLMLGLSLGCRF